MNNIPAGNDVGWQLANRLKTNQEQMKPGEMFHVVNKIAKLKCT